MKPGKMSKKAILQTLKKNEYGNSNQKNQLLQALSTLTDVHPNDIAWMLFFPDPAIQSMAAVIGVTINCDRAADQLELDVPPAMEAAGR